MLLGLFLGLAVGIASLPPLLVLALWLSSGVRAAVVFGSIVNWPPYDKTDLSRCSPLWVQLAARLVGLFNSETSGPFQGLDRAVPLNITTENGMVCGLRLSPTSEKAATVVQAGNVVVQHRTELYKLLASRLGCEVIAIDYCSCGYSDFCRPSEASVVADVRAVLQSLPQAERDKEPNRGGRWHSCGDSLWPTLGGLGTGIALVSVEALLKEGFHFGGVVLEAPFLSLAAAAGSLLEAALHRPHECAHSPRNEGLEGGVQRHPDRIKKLYLLAALEVEKFKNKTLDAQMTGATQGTMTTAQTLQSLVTQDQSVSSDRALESPWRGCEAFHIYLLSQRQLYEGQFEQAMKTSLRLAEYEDILDTQTIYSLIALTTYYNKYYMQCSKAFIKLEASGDISDEMRAKFSDLALSIFTRSTPKDPANGTLLPCPKCHTRIPDSSVSCPSCNHRLAFCVASGRSIFPGSLYPEDRGGNSQYPPGAGPSNETIKCRVCRHRMYTSEVRKLRNCPLCHSRLDIPAPPPIHSLG
eukprot:s175_g20.t3